MKLRSSGVSFSALACFTFFVIGKCWNMQLRPDAKKEPFMQGSFLERMVFIESS